MKSEQEIKKALLLLKNQEERERYEPAKMLIAKKIESLEWVLK